MGEHDYESVKYKEIFDQMVQDEKLFLWYLSSLISESEDHEDVKTKQKQLKALTAYFLEDEKNFIPKKGYYMEILEKIGNILKRDEEK